MGVTYMATPFISVILLGIFWRRVGYMAALVGLLGGLVIQIFLAVALPAAGMNLHWLYTGAIAQILTMSLTALAALITKPTPRAQSEPFHWRPSVVAHLQDTRVRPWWQRARFGSLSTPFSGLASTCGSGDHYSWLFLVPRAPN